MPLNLEELIITRREKSN